MAKPFPSDFYVVCAIVIPVLFLALVVQGGTYEAMLNAARNAARALPRRTWNYVLARFLPWVAYLAVAGALGGELLSLLALFSDSDTYQPRLVVLITTISLMGVVAAAPAWRWWQVRRAVARQRLRPVVGLPGSPSSASARACDLCGRHVILLPSRYGPSCGMPGVRNSAGCEMDL